PCAGGRQETDSPTAASGDRCGADQDAGIGGGNGERPGPSGGLTSVPRPGTAASSRNGRGGRDSAPTASRGTVACSACTGKASSRRRDTARPLAGAHS